MTTLNLTEKRMRDRLMEIVSNALDRTCGVSSCAANIETNDSGCLGCLVDELLANGVIVPPCKVGDKIYFDGKHFARHCAGKIMERTVDAVLTEVWNTFRGEVDVSFDFNDFGKTVFLTREEAERALRKEDEGK